MTREEPQEGPIGPVGRGLVGFSGALAFVGLVALLLLGLFTLVVVVIGPDPFARDLWGLWAFGAVGTVIGAGGLIILYKAARSTVG